MKAGLCSGAQAARLADDGDAQVVTVPVLLAL